MCFIKGGHSSLSVGFISFVTLVFVVAVMDTDLKMEKS